MKFIKVVKAVLVIAATITAGLVCVVVNDVSVKINTGDWGVETRGLFGGYDVNINDTINAADSVSDKAGTTKVVAIAGLLTVCIIMAPTKPDNVYHLACKLATLGVAVWSVNKAFTL